MKDSSVYSSILALSKQAETISMLQKHYNHLQLSEGAYSAMQQTVQIHKQLAGIFNSSAYIDSIKHTAELKKQFQDTSSVVQAVSSLQGVLKTVSSLSSQQKAYFDSVSPINISRIKSVTEGIHFHDEHVELTMDVKEILDSIPNESVPDEPMPDENPSDGSAPDEPNAAETLDDESLSESELSTVNNVVNTPQPVRLSLKDFIEKYVEKLIALTNLCLMIIQTVVPDSAIITPLTDQIVPYAQNISAFCDECRQFFSQNDGQFFEYLDELIDTYDRNTESNNRLAESNNRLAESNNRLAEAYERFSNSSTAENNTNDY